MARTETFPWDAADSIKSDEDAAAYLDAALEDGDPALVAAAIGDIARARGMSEIASATGNPELATVLKVVHALGLRLTTAPQHHQAAQP